MLRVARGGTLAAGRRRWSAALFALGFAWLLTQSGGHAQVTPLDGPLTFFKNYFLTGDYAVGTFVRGSGVTGLGTQRGTATGTITLAGVPANADIVGAFLYWQVVSKDGPNSGGVGAKFNGNPLWVTVGQKTQQTQLLLAKVLTPAGTPQGMPVGTAACWSFGGDKSGVPSMTYTYRADVLKFMEFDATGRFVHGPYTVHLPDSGPSMNSVPLALGASLVVVYQDRTMPLKGIVLYDGGYTTDRNTPMMSQTIRGFYQSTQTPTAGSAKVTYIAGSGQASKSQRLRLFPFLPASSAVIPPVLDAINPFRGGPGVGAWDNPTFPVNLPANTASASTVIEHVGKAPFDCLSWGAIVLSTSVQDSDGDGLLDVWEDANPPSDPNGQPLPNLKAMGADKYAKDLFVEVGHMSAGPGTLYGDVSKPEHTHRPTLAALRMVGDAFSKQWIRVHFDVGNNYQGVDGMPYIIPAAFARGGELIDEMKTVCTRGPADPPWKCQYSEYPGTVGWKTGFKFLRDELLSAAPPPLTPAGDDPCELPGNDGSGQSCERRFDRNRKDMFRYVLFAHALGLPKALCMTNDGLWDDVCLANNGDFHIPRTNSGIADFSGGDLMVALGGFPDAAGLPVGTPFMQASTLMHELGHTFELTHAGAPVPQPPPPLPPLAREPNCKPNYLSVMNYLFQLRGLFNDTYAGVPQLDYSGSKLGAINETGLVDGLLSGAPYYTGWYIPWYATQGIGSPAKRHCSGSDLLTDASGKPIEPAMVRIDSSSLLVPIDWNMDGIPSNNVLPQDVNFDGLTTTLKSPEFNDWDRLRLNQVGNRRNVGGFFLDENGKLALGPLSLDIGRGDIGRGDIGRGDIGRGDIGRGDIGRGDIGRGDIGRGDIGRGDIGRGDIGRGDIGRGDIGRGDIGIAADEIDSDIAAASGNTPPNGLKACVVGFGDCTGTPNHRNRLDWKAPNVGSVDYYKVRRFEAGQPTQEVGQVPAVLGVVDYSVVDTHELRHGTTYTYYVTATFVGGTESGPSNLVPIVAVNDAPTANNQPIVINEDAPALTIALTASDVDSAGPLTYTVVTESEHGTRNGTAPSVTYKPHSDYFGPDSFTFKANDTKAPYNVPGRDSLPATVSITVNPVNDKPSFTKGSDQTVNEDVGGQKVNAWATNFIFGPANESGQAVDSFIVSNDNTALFSVPPAVSPAGILTYTPAPNKNGTATVTVRLRDNGGTQYGGFDTSDPTSFIITVRPVNDAPTFTKGTDPTVNEDAGAQTVNAWATSISAGPEEEPTSQIVTVSVSNNNNLLFFVQPTLSGTNGTRTLMYTPATNQYGSAIVTVTLTDNGVTDYGGSNTSAQTFTITVNPVNDAPSFTAGGNSTAPEDAGQVTVDGWAKNFIFGPNESGQAVDSFIVSTISTTNVALFSGPPAVSPTGTLTYTSALHQHGSATVSVQLKDSGGVLNGGIDTSAAQTFSITVTPVNDAPAGADNTVTTLEDAAKTFVASDFGFTDPVESNGFFNVKITTAPGAGLLKNNGTVLVAEAFVPVADISAGKLTFIPAADASGSPYASFTFQVQDDGGGADLDPLPNTMTINVVPLLWVATTSANCIVNESPEVAVAGNAVTMGVVRGNTSMSTCIHGASASLPQLTPGNTKYEVTFSYNLFTWDSYNALGASGTGYFDSFSVSVSGGAPYASLTLKDPLTGSQTLTPGTSLSLGFVWGGNNYADGTLECNPACTSVPAAQAVVIPGNASGSYLNVVLDTKTLPEANHAYPSYGTITILSVVQKP